jgi:hypothetical protein
MRREALGVREVDLPKNLLFPPKSDSKYDFSNATFGKAGSISKRQAAGHE